MHQNDTTPTYIPSKLRYLFDMKKLISSLRPVYILLFALLPTVGIAADIDRFIGKYSGSAEYVYEGKTENRDLSATILPTDRGFSLSWTSVSYKSDGRRKEKTYTIDFAQSDRAHIYGSAMQTNVFGKEIPLDPLAGEPYVWARIVDDTFTVFSLFINEAGEYEMQEYHRTLATGGLDLVFRSVNPGGTDKVIEAFLKRVE